MDQNLRHLLKEKYKYTETQLINLKTSDLDKDIQNDIKSLEQKTPLAYLIGHVSFLSTNIDLRFKTLIPRPETEYWTEIYIKKIKALNLTNPEILDIFCGSGCIGIAIAKNLKNAKISFSDISENAILQTQKNLEINNIPEEQFTIHKGNLFERIKDKKFDVILANPPYVEDFYEDMGLKFEPAAALFAGKDGLNIIRKFLEEAKNYLKPNGFIVMEFGENQEEGISNILNEKGFKDFTFYKDQFDKDRWVKISSKD